MDMPTTVLIVDDDNIDRRVIKSRLPEDRYKIIEAANIADAERYVDGAESPGCVILDYLIPGANSLEFLKQLCAKDIPAIIITSAGSEAVAVEAMKIGAYEYLTKDAITEASLQSAIGQVMERHSLKLAVLRKQAEMEHFALTAAHDLRAPLRQLRFFVERLMASQGGAGSASASAYKEDIFGALNFMSQLIDNLLNFATVNNADLNDTVDLNYALEEIQGLLAELVNEKQARISRDKLPTIQCNRILIMQLLENLITNAIKYKCESRPPHIEFSAAPHDTGWLIQCKDNGRGIHQKYTESIFSPFTKYNSDSSSKSAGLGLAICKKIVELHGGKIWCSSTENLGTTFFFTLKG